MVAAAERLGPSGLGIGWRAELNGVITRDCKLFLEVVAENVDARELPTALAGFIDDGRVAIPHGIRLSLGGAELPEAGRLDHLARLAERFGAPLVSEHIAFASAHGVDAGHVLPVPHTEQALEIIVENVTAAQRALGVPLALEHVAALAAWPDAELPEAEFIAEVVRRSDALLLLDVANLYANGRNHGYDPVGALDHLPLDRLAYVHVGGGVERDGRYYDTHLDPVHPGVLALLEEVCTRVEPPGILLERDGEFPSDDELVAELDAIAATAARGAARRARAA